MPNPQVSHDITVTQICSEDLCPEYSATISCDPEDHWRVTLSVQGGVMLSFPANLLMDGLDSHSTGKDADNSTMHIWPHYEGTIMLGRETDPDTVTVLMLRREAIEAFLLEAYNYETS